MGLDYTLQGTNISPSKALLKMIFLFRRWDMLIPWRVVFDTFLKRTGPRNSRNFRVAFSSFSCLPKADVWAHLCRCYMWGAPELVPRGMLVRTTKVKENTAVMDYWVPLRKPRSPPTTMICLDWWFFTDCTTGFSTITWSFGRICLEFFSKHLKQNHQKGGYNDSKIPLGWTKSSWKIQWKIWERILREVGVTICGLTMFFCQVLWKGGRISFPNIHWKILVQDFLGRIFNYKRTSDFLMVWVGRFEDFEGEDEMLRCSIVASATPHSSHIPIQSM